MADSPPLTPAQFDRYRRHLTLPELGVEGQQALLAGRVLLIGAGGLGCWGRGPGVVGKAKPVCEGSARSTQHAWGEGSNTHTHPGVVVLGRRPSVHKFISA